MLNLPRIHIGKISFLLAILTWLALLFVDITRIFQDINRMEPSMAREVSYTLEILFFILVYVFYNHNLQKHENTDFLNMIWRGASTGLLALIVAVAINMFYKMLGDTRLAQDPLLSNFFYHVLFALISIFLISNTLLWRHLILYQKTKKVVQQWQAFEVLLLVSMFFVYINGNTFDYSFLFGLVFLGIFSASLSINLKWIPYLTFKEKWKSILFLSVVIASSGYLFLESLSYSDTEVAFVNLTDNLFLIGLFVFVFLYALSSFLVTLFNLPTSSVFEQKLVEAINFQRLSQSIKPGQDENQVLDILVDSSMSAAYADAGWLEMVDSEGEKRTLHERFIEPQVRKELSELINRSKPFVDFDWNDTENVSKRFFGKLRHPYFQSAFVIPLVINHQTIGRLILAKEVKDGFNKEMVNIITTFVGQACISVENYRLLSDAIRTERYKEELKIAQRVQRSLLPRELHHDDSFEICGFSQAADEVGGDYYETKELDKGQFAIIIGDVSGKGTSAAFNMSQMKGIFHSLIQINPSPTEFMEKANLALGRCLEKNHFITTTYCLLDTEKKELRYCRAGHCPTLYYNAKQKKADYLISDGLGLGILRNQQYGRYIHESSVKYTQNDILVMYTDGIVEAKNNDGEEFGYERLKNVLADSHTLSATDIQQNIIKKVFEFVGETGIPDDDFTMMVLKFHT
jgi:hypothetical protein